MKTLSIVAAFLLFGLDSFSQNVRIKYFNISPRIDTIYDVVHRDQDSLMILGRFPSGKIGVLKTDLFGEGKQNPLTSKYDSFEYHGAEFKPRYRHGAPILTEDLSIIQNFTFGDSICDYLGAKFFEHHVLVRWGTDGKIKQVDFDSLCELTHEGCARKSLFKSTNGGYFFNQGYSSFDPEGGINYSHWNYLSAYNSQHELKTRQPIGGATFSSGGWMTATGTSDLGFMICGYDNGAPENCYIEDYSIRVLQKLSSSGSLDWEVQFDDEDFTGYDVFYPESMAQIGPSHYGIVGTSWPDVVTFLSFENNFINPWNRVIQIPYSRIYSAEIKAVSDETGIILTKNRDAGGTERIGFVKVGKYGNYLSHHVYIIENHYDNFMVVDTSIYFWGNNSAGAFLGIFTQPDLHVSGTGEDPNSRIAVYPNPTSGSINLENVRSPYRYSLVDMMGRTVQQGGVSPGESQLDIAKEKSGYYILILEDEHGNSYPHRIIKL